MEPCALADVTWSDAKTLELAARGPHANLSRQGGDPKGCGIPSSAEGLLVDGSSGRSSAPHLHFNAYRPGAGAESDPFDANPDAALWVDPPLPGLLPGAACQGNQPGLFADFARLRLAARALRVLAGAAFRVGLR